MNPPSNTIFGIILDICKQEAGDQAQIDAIVKSKVKDLETEDFVEAQNLVVKIQKAFTNHIFGPINQ